MGYLRVQVFPLAVLVEVIFIGDFCLYLFSFNFKSFFSFFLKKKKKKAQDALCSLLLLMGVVLMTARVHAEEKIGDLLVVNFHVNFFTALLRNIFFLIKLY